MRTRLLAVALFGVLPLGVLPLIGQQKPPAAKAQKPLVTAAEVKTTWPLASVKLAPFPALPAGEQIEGGTRYKVELKSPRGASRVWIHVPKDAKAKATPCVLIAPAGSNLIFGASLDDSDQPEQMPWLAAGFVVVAYEVDGVMPEAEQQTDDNVLRQLRCYAESWAGLQNARGALEYALAKVPAIDGKRLFAAGHSSAATTALLFAAHEPRLRGVAAFMPIADVVKRIPEENQVQLESDFPGYRNFLARSSPQSHLAAYKSPVFVFSAEDDSNVPFADVKAFAEQLATVNKSVTFEHVATGDHYDPMIQTGIHLAIAWAQKQ